MSSRASIVVTGTEVLTGRVADRNGPWLAEQLRLAGVDVAHVVVVGDRAEDLRDALTFVTGTGVDLVITSGGLGPTADDLTAEVVGRFQGRDLRLDADLEVRIADIFAGLTSSRGWRLDPEATAAAIGKQALVPAGAQVLGPVGTAPGLVIPAADGHTGPPIVVLPGPPREVQAMWPAVLDEPVVQAALAGREELRQRTIRLWGTPESELAAMLRGLDTRLAGLEITTCLHDGELEIVTRFAPTAQAAYDDVEASLCATYRESLVSTDGATVDDIVAGALVADGLTIATAESCTAGLLAARLTERPGSSAYLAGGVVAYSNQAKQDLLGVPARSLDTVGAVSAEVAAAMAAGARGRFGANVGVGITGIAGPEGGSDAKPIGLVHLCVLTDDRTVTREVHLPGSRGDVRRRAVLVALHLLRQTLSN